MTSFLPNFARFVSRYRVFIVFLILLLVHIFLRFYQLEERANFGWDQTDNAWAAQRIIIEKKYPLIGMVAKLSAINIGPLYYYFISFFYFLTNMDPVASPLAAGFTSIINFFIIFYVIKKIFNLKTAFLAIFIYTVSFPLIDAYRTQGPINFIAPVSLLIFYFLYRVLRGENFYILPMALIVGLSLHVHFTSVFYPIIILLAIPFFPKNKTTLYYLLLSLPIVLIFLLPNIIRDIQDGTSMGNILLNYGQTYYHGFHLRRMLQISHDAFIEFESILSIGALRNSVFVYLPLFILINFFNQRRKNLPLCYLAFLWFFVPWVVFATYSGEITHYYFYSTMFIVILILSFLTMWLWGKNSLVLRLIIISFWGYYTFFNLHNFLISRTGNFQSVKKSVQEIIKTGGVVQFEPNNPISYFYYVYSRKK